MFGSVVVQEEGCGGTKRRKWLLKGIVRAHSLLPRRESGHKEWRFRADFWQPIGEWWVGS